MARNPVESNRPAWRRLDVQSLRKPMSPDEMGIGEMPLVASDAPGEIREWDANAFADCIAHYNPLGQFGAAWTAGSWLGQRNDR